jgi:hypothetical protein
VTVFKESNEVQFSVRSENWKRAAEIAENKLEKFGCFWSGWRRMRVSGMFPNNARFALWQFIARGKCYTFNRLKKAFSCGLSNMAHAMMPKIHCFKHSAEESRLDRPFSRRIDEFEIHEVEIVGLFAFIDVLARSIWILPQNDELPIIHATTKLASDGHHSTNREKIDARWRSVKTVSEFDGRGNTSQSETYKTVATGLGQKNPLIHGLHWPSLGGFICPEDVAVLEKMGWSPGIQDAGKAAVRWEKASEVPHRQTFRHDARQVTHIGVEILSRQGYRRRGGYRS